MKLIRESARAKRALHRNATTLHEGRLLRSKLERVDDNTARYTFVHEASENFSSKFVLELSRDDLARALETMGEDK